MNKNPSEAIPILHTYLIYEEDDHQKGLSKSVSIFLCINFIKAKHYTINIDILFLITKQVTDTK